MKKFILTSFALTLFSTANVFGASNDMLNFLTINGKPLSSYQDFNQNHNNNLGNNQNNNNNNNLGNNQNNNNNNNLGNNQNNNSNNNLGNNQNNNNDESITDTSISNTEREVVRLVNIERQKAGLAPLKIDSKLCQIAKLKSEDMKKKGYFSHTSPTYGTPFDMLKQFNVTYKTAGENIAKGQKDAKAVVDAWMNSPGHRKNILSKSFTHIGVGNVKGSSNYWTQLFISK